MVKKDFFLKRWLKSTFDHLPLSDELYTKIRYFYRFRRVLDLKSPKSFNQKLHWLNLSGYLDRYTALVDKYEVRNYVSKKIGSQFLNKLYGVYENEINIDFEELPQKFVLKTTHGSNWNIYCKDKNELDEEATKAQLRKWLNTNYYPLHRERIYRAIPPRIICERFLEGKGQYDISDHKFLCFNGRVQFIHIILNWFADGNDHYAGIYFDRNWEICPFWEEPHSPKILEKPESLDRMIEVAEILAEGIPFVRIDLFNEKDKIIFGEMTFMPNAGYGKFHPPKWDITLGSYLQLPS